MKKKIIISFFIFFIFSTLGIGQVRIKMQKENGVYLTPCTVNGLKLRFIFDTGASNVCISISEATFMLKNGYLKPSDIKGASYSQIANGDVIKNTTVLLKELEIGGLKLYDIEAVIIHELSAPLLLGQSAIEKLGRIQLENDELVILRGNQSDKTSNCQDAIKLVSQGKEYFFKGLFSLANDNYEKAYDLCPESVDCPSMFLFGKSEYYTKNYEMTIKYLEKAKLCENDSIISLLNHDIYSTIGISNLFLEDYKISILNLEKSLLYTNDKMELSSDYFYLGLANSKLSNNQDFVQYLEKSIELYCISNKISFSDAVKGYVDDKVLGERYFNLSLGYAKVNLSIKSDNFMMIAAICGSDQAAEFCNTYALDYKKLRDLARNRKN